MPLRLFPLRETKKNKHTYENSISPKSRKCMPGWEEWSGSPYGLTFDQKSEPFEVRDGEYSRNQGADR